MILKNRLESRSARMRLGFACFLLANATHYFIRPSGSLARDVVDGIFGLLIGLTIGLLLWSLRPDGSRHSSHG